MDTIHLTIQGHDFHIPKQTLEKFDFFKGLLEIQQDNFELYDICPYTFNNIINLINKSNLEKDAAILSDKLGLERDESIFTSSYYCKKDDCNLFVLNGKYCEN